MRGMFCDFMDNVCSHRFGEPKVEAWGTLRAVYMRDVWLPDSWQGSWQDTLREPKLFIWLYWGTRFLTLHGMEVSFKPYLVRLLQGRIDIDIDLTLQTLHAYTLFLYGPPDVTIITMDRVLEFCSDIECPEATESWLQYATSTIPLESQWITFILYRLYKRSV